MSAIVAAEVAIVKAIDSEVKNTPNKGRNKGKGNSPNKTPRSAKGKGKGTPRKVEVTLGPAVPPVPLTNETPQKPDQTEGPLIGQETAAAVEMTEADIVNVAALDQQQQPDGAEPVASVAIVKGNDEDDDSDDDFIDPAKRRAAAKAKAEGKSKDGPKSRETANKDKDKGRNGDRRQNRDVQVTRAQPVAAEKDLDVLKNERITDVKLRVRAEELVSDYIPESKDTSHMFVNVELVDGANTYKMSLYSVPRSIGLSQDLRTWRGLMFGAKRFKQCDFLQLVQMYHSLSSSLNATFCEMIFDKQSMYYHTALKQLDMLGDNSAVIRDAVNSNQMLKLFLIGTLNAKRAQYVHTSRVVMPQVVSFNAPVISSGDLNVPGDMILDEEFLKTSVAASSDHVVIEPIMGFDNNDANSEFDMY